jgi:O-antigen/teichoic acid export membrane protein
MIDKFKNELNHSKMFINFSLLNIMGQGVMFITPLIIAKILSPEGFGSYSLSMMIVFLFTSAFIASSQTPFIVYANEENKSYSKINKAFSIQLLFLVISIIFFIALTFVFSKYITNFIKISNFQLLFLFLAYIGIGLNSFVQNIFLALNKKIYYSLFFLTYGIANFILLLIFYFQNNLNLNTVFLIYFISSIVSTVIFLNKIEFKKLFPFVFDKKLFLDFFNWTKWQIMGLTAVYFINWGDNLVLRYFVSMEEIGAYNLAYQIFKGLISLTYILNSYFITFISQNIDDGDKIRNYLYIKRPKILLTGTLGIIFIFITVPYFFDRIYGGVYIHSVNVLRILLAGLFFHLYIIFYIPLFNSMKKYEFIQTVNVIQIIINICLDIILVSKIGIIGAAIATTSGYFVTLILYERYYLYNIANR